MKYVVTVEFDGPQELATFINDMERYRVRLAKAEERREIQLEQQNAPLAAEGMSLRTKRALLQAGYRTLDDVATCTDTTLLKLGNIGRKSLMGLREFAWERGIRTPAQLEWAHRHGRGES